MTSGSELEECQKCSAHISCIDDAYACELECTFCPDCAEQYGHTCPNCSGELRLRRLASRPPGA